MSNISRSNGSYGVKAGDPVFAEGQRVDSVNILAKGKVDVYISGGYRLFSIDQNMFIGANDLFLSGSHSFSYKASEDSIIFSYYIDSIAGLEELFRQKNDYSTYILNSICDLTEYSFSSLKKLEQLLRFLNTAADNLCLFFWIMKEKHGFAHEPVHPVFGEGKLRLQRLKEENVLLPYSFDAEFMKCSHSEYDCSLSKKIDTLKMDYYKSIRNLNTDLKKQFLNEGFTIPQYCCTDISLLLDSIRCKIGEAFDTAKKYIELLYSKTQPSILGEYLKACTSLKDSIHDPVDMIDVQHYILDIIKHTAEIFRSDYDHIINIDMRVLEQKVEHSSSGLRHEAANTSFSLQSAGERNDIPEELQNSVEKILDYSNIPKDRYDLFMYALNAFRGLKDKLSDDDAVRRLRKDMTAVFFEVYEAVFKRVVAEKNRDKLFSMFLNYSYMDEKLLSPKNVWMLYEMDDDYTEGQTPVFKLKSWLQLIYEKKKDPSVNEFSLDYFDVFREMRKRGEVKDKDKAAYENNVDGRLKFEINNMFKHNHRLCNKIISTYFPILYDDVIVKDLNKALVTPEKIDAAIQKVLDIDYSAFHREISYFNMKKGIEKEFIMQAVRPDIILMPTYGNNPIMWQEISGRVRNTPGRFIIPIFADGSLDDMLLRMIGEFRWELCKTMMGVAWNDISIKSLTSEYMDYLQFFKKNRDISEESKEKLKQQIKKHRNITRQIFASDYAIWVKYESNGNTRLNKPAREILYKYCPFSREIREKLLNHPSFSAAANQFRIMRAKQVKDLENRYSKYTQNGIALDEVMIETLEFYRDL